MKLNLASGQLASRMSERRIGKVSVHIRQVRPVEQVEQLSSQLYIGLLTMEPGHVDKFGDVQVHVRVSRLIIGISAQIAFLAQRGIRKCRSSKQAIQIFLSRLATEVVAERGAYWARRNRCRLR